MTHWPVSGSCALLVAVVCHWDSSLCSCARSSGGCGQHKVCSLHLESMSLYILLCSARATARQALGAACRQPPAALPVWHLSWDLGVPVLLFLEQMLSEVSPLLGVGPLKERGVSGPMCVKPTCAWPQRKAFWKAQERKFNISFQETQLLHNRKADRATNEVLTDSASYVCSSVGC